MLLFSRRWTVLAVLSILHTAALASEDTPSDPSDVAIEVTQQVKRQETLASAIFGLLSFDDSGDLLIPTAVPSIFSIPEINTFSFTPATASATAETVSSTSPQTSQASSAARTSSAASSSLSSATPTSSAASSTITSAPVTSSTSTQSSSALSASSTSLAWVAASGTAAANGTAPSATAVNHGLSENQKLAIGLGIGIPVAALLAFGLAFVCIKRHRDSKHRYEKTYPYDRQQSRFGAIRPIGPNSNPEMADAEHGLSDRDGLIPAAASGAGRNVKWDISSNEHSRSGSQSASRSLERLVNRSKEALNVVGRKRSREQSYPEIVHPYQSQSASRDLASSSRDSRPRDLRRIISGPQPIMGSSNTEPTTTISPLIKSPGIPPPPPAVRGSSASGPHSQAWSNKALPYAPHDSDESPEGLRPVISTIEPLPTSIVPVTSNHSTPRPSYESLTTAPDSSQSRRLHEYVPYNPVRNVQPTIPEPAIPEPVVDHSQLEDDHQRTSSDGTSPESLAAIAEATTARARSPSLIVNLRDTPGRVPSVRDFGMVPSTLATAAALRATSTEVRNTDQIDDLTHQPRVDTSLAAATTSRAVGAPSSGRPSFDAPDVSPISRRGTASSRRPSAVTRTAYAFRPYRPQSQTLSPTAPASMIPMSAMMMQQQAQQGHRRSSTRSTAQTYVSPVSRASTPRVDEFDEDDSRDDDSGMATIPLMLAGPDYTREATQSQEPFYQQTHHLLHQQPTQQAAPQQPQHETDLRRQVTSGAYRGHIMDQYLRNNPAGPSAPESMAAAPPNTAIPAMTAAGRAGSPLLPPRNSWVDGHAARRWSEGTQSSLRRVTTSASGQSSLFGPGRSFLMSGDSTSEDESPLFSPLSMEENATRESEIRRLTGLGQPAMPSFVAGNTSGSISSPNASGREGSGSGNVSSPNASSSYSRNLSVGISSPGSGSMGYASSGKVSSGPAVSSIGHTTTASSRQNVNPPSRVSSTHSRSSGSSVHGMRRSVTAGSAWDGMLRPLQLS